MIDTCSIHNDSAFHHGHIHIIYQSKNNNKLVIRELNPDTLEIINNWETNAKQKRSYGALFMIGKILFCIERYDSSPTKIIYK